MMGKFKRQSNTGVAIIDTYDVQVESTASDLAGNKKSGRAERRAYVTSVVGSADLATSRILERIESTVRKRNPQKRRA